MAEPVIPGDLLTLLQQVDTPTVCNAIEVAQGKRGYEAYTKGTKQCSAPGQSMVGFARTGNFARRVTATDDPDVIRARRLDYFRNMAEGPRPAIAVLEDMDYPDCVSAWWGEVHTNVHKGLGLNGALTNGVMRDLGDLAEGFPVVAGSIGPSHAFVHVRELGTPVNVFGMTVNQGDLVHADRHGGLVLPPEVIPNLKAAIEKMWAGEQIILGPAKEPDFDLEKLLEAWRAFEKART